jgi:phytoene/squalene synthetase
LSTPGFEWTWDDFRSQLRQSSFAPAMLLMDATARRDLEVYYAFCRAVDDSVDDYGPVQGQQHLQHWEEAINAPPGAAEPLLLRELRRLCAERGIPLHLLQELIEGARSDLRPKVEFETRADLFNYCHQVAGVVGQASLRIFGLGAAQGTDYAETLGRAFQLINIVRDAREDAERGRNYFALEDLKACGSPQATADAYARMALECLRDSDALSARLPSGPLRPSRLMRALYGGLLDAMLADGLRVFEKRYRLNPLVKIWIILKSLAR